MTEITNTLGVLVRKDPVTNALTPTSCRACGCTWGIRDQLIPNIDPYLLTNSPNNAWPKTISCGQCGRLLD